MSIYDRNFMLLVTKCEVFIPFYGSVESNETHAQAATQSNPLLAAGEMSSTCKMISFRILYRLQSTLPSNKSGEEAEDTACLL